MELTSPAFADGGMIPAKYTCDGDRLLSPPLAVSGVPEGTKSLALVMDDPDIPQEVKDARGIDVFDHWTLYGIPADTTEIPEGASIGSAGLNGAGNAAYTGPCPPPEYEPKVHRYIFKLYALSIAPTFDAPPTKAELEAAMEGATLARAELVGKYSRA
ncbi:MAG: YbhB/YbcL family Raf kinase inhibitor-like protein [Patescibacteria group bacterium]|nr:YbhB/YbcL family Raf kinase inhibitor-like protein [Patescibacteria group bacterium]MDE1966215.1 YbhB/YbcL family Raf kinase inhibitor-like protein [Patescibacteria group bacterium]